MSSHPMLRKGTFHKWLPSSISNEYENNYPTVVSEMLCLALLGTVVSGMPCLVLLVKVVSEMPSLFLIGTVV